MLGTLLLFYFRDPNPTPLYINERTLTWTLRMEWFICPLLNYQPTFHRRAWQFCMNCKLKYVVERTRDFKNWGRHHQWAIPKDICDLNVYIFTGVTKYMFLSTYETVALRNPLALWQTKSKSNPSCHFPDCNLGNLKHCNDITQYRTQHLNDTDEGKSHWGPELGE